ncbi:DUF7673 family protein [Massilia sp. TSP1-1-2]|uniref:DUF7673 family protein n=1 Tax=Massilia sp. TSP1-1-2 TaxID=2804649 RepID=UPI003CF06E1A
MQPIPPREKRTSVTVEVPASQFEAFNETVSAFFTQSRGGTTSAQKAAEVRAQDRDAGIDSLDHLLKITERDSGQCGTIAHFLASLYNGLAFPFPLGELRGLDADLFEHCLAVLRLDNRPVNAIENYFTDGDARFQRMLTDWGIVTRPAPQPEPERGERYNVVYITHGTVPGYRRYILHCLLEHSDGKAIRIELDFDQDGSASVARDILEIHRSAWFNNPKDGPIDKEPNELAPRWIGPRAAWEDR